MPTHSAPLAVYFQDTGVCLQAFEPDLALTDIALVGGAALADKLGIPKAVLSVPGLLPPVSGHSYGSGASLRSTVPQWMTLLPKHMASSTSAHPQACRLKSRQSMLLHQSAS